ncbi:Polymerase/histidinol phosphatase-like protein [Jimgerdemannia flammicorona]|uniref:Polymerase/histidinol phosphatase-like protein n=2 Tax=Jimgerdemannia flammicorona TaxID=994334 RepID=A0A433QDW0_9FUNG|nr:Polymerase/histidinol phosphatase-like protein [Jimgerdemannia flammicorona]RUS27942.1 Polymerase/histidinol phosphatase-like protein [Jimgerdemannia flammicorona]
MPFSHHSHSGQFCSHASGILEDIVLEAIRKGFKIYGLSEHMPRYAPTELYPEEIEANLSVADLYAKFESFLTEARRLQEKYRSQITLLVGTEIEYITPSYKSHIKAFLAKHTIDYVVGSLHHVNGIPIDFSKELYTQALASISHDGNASLPVLFERYFNEQYEMLVAVRPDVVAHFDLIRIFEPVKGMNVTKSVWQSMVRNADFVIGYGGLFELNSRAWKKGLVDAYPQRDILKYIISRGGKLTLSDDSHGPADVGMYYDRLYNYLEIMEITTLYHLDYDECSKVVVKELRDARDHQFWVGVKNW